MLATWPLMITVNSPKANLIEKTNMAKTLEKRNANKRTVDPKSGTDGYRGLNDLFLSAFIKSKGLNNVCFFLRSFLVHCKT